MWKSIRFTIGGMIVIVGFLGTFGALSNELLFNIIGIVLATIICLTFFTFWICLMIVLCSATKATISAGKGVGFLMSTLVDKISK